MPEKMNVQVSNPNKKTLFVKPLPYATLVRWIKNQDYDTHIEEELVKEISKYSSGAYKHFQKNIVNHVARIQKEMRESPE